MVRAQINSSYSMFMKIKQILQLNKLESGIKLKIDSLFETYRTSSEQVLEVKSGGILK